MRPLLGMCYCMNKIARIGLFTLAGFASSFLSLASSFLPTATDGHIQMSAAVFRGTVLNTESYADAADGQIYTRTVIQVDEVFKGKLPSRIKLVHRGGTVGNQGEADGFAPQFKVGEERLLFVARRADGTLYATRGSASAFRLPTESLSPTDAGSPELAVGEALLQELRDRTIYGVIPGSDLTDQAASLPELTPLTPPKGPNPQIAASSTATNLMVDGNGIPARFILPDRGEPIPYLIDADYLPTGITQTQAVTAVQNALAAWTNATSLRYRFAGIQSFGAAAANITTSDGILRIQLHDRYNYIGGERGDAGTRRPRLDGSEPDQRLGQRLDHRWQRRRERLPQGDEGLRRFAAYQHHNAKPEHFHRSPHP